METTKIVLDLTPEQVKAIQNAFTYASWQFPKGGDPDRDRDAEHIRKIHEQIEEKTGIKGVF